MKYSYYDYLKGLEDGLIIKIAEGNTAELKIFRLNSFVSLVNDALKTNNDSSHFNSAVNDLIKISLENFIQEFRDQIKTVIFNVNIRIPSISNRTDNYGLILWELFHQLYFNMARRYNIVVQPKYLFCSFLPFDNLLHKSIRSNVMELKSHEYKQLPLDSDFFDEVVTNSFNPKTLIIPGAYLLYCGYKHSEKESETIEFKKRGFTFRVIDDKQYEWDTVFSTMLPGNYISKDNSYSNKTIILHDLYLKEPHKDTNILSRDEIEKLSGAVAARKLSNAKKNIVMFTESSKIRYYKILKEYAGLKGWYTKQLNFGDDFKNNAINTFYDFREALSFADN